MPKVSQEWSTAVLVQIDGRELSVDKTVDALSLLQGDWPIDSLRRDTAMLACATALTGDLPEVAQAAFMLAAIEAGILLNP